MANVELELSRADEPMDVWEDDGLVWVEYPEREMKRVLDVADARELADAFEQYDANNDDGTDEVHQAEMLRAAADRAEE